MEVVLRITLVAVCCLHYVLSQSSVDTLVGNAIQQAAGSVTAERAPASASTARFAASGAGGPTQGGTIGTAIWYHSLFSQRNDPPINEELSNRARIAIRATRIINNSTGSFAATMSNPEIAESFQRQFQPLCYNIPTCDPSQPYRNTDGTCNNLVYNVLWGAAFTPMQRYLTPVYQDGLDAPRTLSVTGGPLPSSRDVSNAIHDNEFIEYVSPYITPFLTHFGQFIDHDITNNPTMKGPMGEIVEYCCQQPDRPECFSIRISPFDPRFSPRTCMHFVRSDITPDFNCRLAPRLPLNQRSSFIDGTMIYGWDRDKELTLRTRIGGLLKVSSSHPMYPGLLPEGNPDSCVLEPGSPHCFDAGDHRNTETPPLTVMHTTFMRRHNRIAERLRFLGVSNDDEVLFQEAKRIVIAELQHVTYTEFLPLVLHDSYMTYFGLKSTQFGHNTMYRPDVNPSTSVNFGTAAYRFGHSLVRNILRHIPGNTHLLEDHFDRPLLLHSPTVGCERLARWMSTDGKARSDAFLENGLRNNLFKGPLPNDGISTDAFDLAALNIQRGRDHGLPGYNAFRQWCGRQRAFHFGTGYLGLTDHDAQTASKLGSIFDHPDDIDLFAGGRSEVNLPGSVIGPTFSCLIANQFALYKFGDRFWYENNFPVTGFTYNQINQIKRTSLAKIFCSTMNKAELNVLQPLLLFRPVSGNDQRPCELILGGDPLGINLSPWLGLPRRGGIFGATSFGLSPLNPGMRGIISPLVSSQGFRVPRISPLGLVSSTVSGISGQQTGFGVQGISTFGQGSSTFNGVHEPETGFGVQGNSGVGAQGNSGFGVQGNSGFGQGLSTGNGIQEPETGFGQAGHSDASTVTFYTSNAEQTSTKSEDD